MKNNNLDKINASGQTDNAKMQTSGGAKACSRRFDGAIFDMDGTLFKTDKGITDSAIYVFERMGLVPPDDETLKSFIGPSLFYSFTQTIGLSEADALRAIELYREKYLSEGINDCCLFPGGLEMLQELSAAGVRLSVASSKPLPSVRRILENFDVARFFLAVSAPPPGIRDSGKTEIIRAAITTENSVMIGDRVFDYEGATANGLPMLWAAYGYAPRGERERCNPAYTAYCSRDITDIVLRRGE